MIDSGGPFNAKTSSAVFNDVARYFARMGTSIASGEEYVASELESNDPPLKRDIIIILLETDATMLSCGVFDGLLIGVFVFC